MTVNQYFKDTTTLFFTDADIKIHTEKSIYSFTQNELKTLFQCFGNWAIDTVGFSVKNYVSYGSVLTIGIWVHKK